VREDVWKIGEVEGYELLEDDHLVYLRCYDHGVFAVFSAQAATGDLLMAAVVEHDRRHFQSLGDTLGSA
jgi:hypothetical protein